MDSWGCEIKEGKVGDRLRINVRAANTKRKLAEETLATSIWKNFLERAEAASDAEAEEMMVTSFTIEGNISNPASVYLKDLKGVEALLVKMLTKEKIEVELRWSPEAEDFETHPTIEMWAVWGS